MKGLGCIISLIIMVMCCDGCIEEERVALLQLYSSFDNCPKFGDCCEWDGVECSFTSGRVTSLSLSIYSYGPRRKEEWYFNASFFLPFRHLTSLDLSIPMAGCIENQGFERLSRLKRLKSLQLYLYLFKDRTMLSSIGTISSLRSIALADLGSELTADQGLLQLKNLESIVLSEYSFNNRIFSFLSGFSSLRSISLYANQFDGTINGTELSKLGKLEVLGLGFMNYNKGIPSFAGLSSLRTLSLYGLELKGIIDLQEIGVTTNLSALYLSNSSSSYQLQSLGAYPDLKTISLTSNNFEGPIFVQGKLYINI